MPVVQCAWCKKEKMVANSRARGHTFHFCNVDCKAKWGIFNTNSQAENKEYVKKDFRKIICDLISEHFKMNGKPKFVSKSQLNPKIIEQVQKIEPTPKYAEMYIKQVISHVLKSDFGYSIPVGSKTETNTLWLVG